MLFNTTTMLPNDILEEIFQYCSTATLIGVSTICHNFHGISTRLLYRHLELKTGRETIGCFRTLSKSSLAARSVRHLWIRFRIDIYPEASMLLQGFFRLLASALPRLIHIKTLEFRVIHRDMPHLAEHFSYVFENCMFPQLSMLLLYTPITATTASFLHRHQDTLKTLFLMPLTEMNPSSTLNLTRVEGWRFPRLSWFHASATVVPIFLSDPSILPSVQKMEVSCTLDPTIIIPNIVRGMKDTVGDRRISRVSFNRSGWNIDLIEEIARGGLRFETLVVHCIWFEHLAEDEMFLSDEKLMRVRNSLAKLSAAGTLNSLFWSIETNSGNYPPPSLTTDEEVQWIIRFGEACPTLDTCQIPHGLHWCRYGNNIWIPDDEPSIKFVGTEWFIDQLHTRRYPALKELLENLETKAEPLSQAFIQAVVKEYQEAGAVVSDTEESVRREKTEDLVIVATLTLFWSVDWHGWLETPAYKRVIERWKVMRDQRKKLVQGQVV